MVNGFYVNRVTTIFQSAKPIENCLKLLVEINIHCRRIDLFRAYTCVEFRYAFKLYDFILFVEIGIMLNTTYVIPIVLMTRLSAGVLHVR